MVEFGVRPLTEEGVCFDEQSSFTFIQRKAVCVMGQSTYDGRF